jgi:preprotein translocase subunit YajC
MIANPRIKLAILSAALVCAGIVFFLAAPGRRVEPTLSYSQLLRQVQAGQVAEVEIAAGNSGANPARVRFKDGQVLRTILPSDYSAALAIMQDKANVEIRDAAWEPVRLLLNATPFLLLLAVWIFLMTRRRFLTRFLSAIMLLGALLAGQHVPLANFSGAVHGVSKKQITIENADGNLIDFEINRKTKVMQGKKEIAPEEIMSGDQVTIQARQEMLQFLVAVIITVQPPPKS